MSPRLRTFSVTASFNLDGGAGSLTRIVKAVDVESALRTRKVSGIRAVMQRLKVEDFNLAVDELDTWRGNIIRIVKDETGAATFGAFLTTFIFSILLTCSACAPLWKPVPPPTFDGHYVISNDKYSKSWPSSPNPCWHCLNRRYLYEQKTGDYYGRYNRHR